MKKVQLEMGGKNPQVVLDDADLATAVELSVQSAFLLHRPALHRVEPPDRDRTHLPAFIDAMQRRMAAIKVGDALAGRHRHRPGVVASPAGAGLLVCGNRQGRRRHAAGRAASA